MRLIAGPLGTDSASCRRRRPSWKERWPWRRRRRARQIDLSRGGGTALLQPAPCSRKNDCPTRVLSRRWRRPPGRSAVIPSSFRITADLQCLVQAVGHRCVANLDAIEIMRGRMTSFCINYQDIVKTLILNRPTVYIWTAFIRFI